MKGNRITEISRTTDDNQECSQEAKGENFVLGGIINFQIRAVCVTCEQVLERKPDGHAGEFVWKADIQLSLKFQGPRMLRNCPTHTVIVKSSALNLHQYFRVEYFSYRLPKIWHTVYDNVVNYRTWTFDIEVTLLVDKINEQVICRSALALLDNQDTTDVELQGTDGTVRAHGCILAAASPVMHSAFYGDFKESKEKKLSVPDANIAVLNMLKQFAYTGYVEGEPSVLATLYQLASRFMMPDLARICAAFLVNDLDGEDLENVLQLDFQFAEPYLHNAMISRYDIKSRFIKSKDNTDNIL